MDPAFAAYFRERFPQEDRPGLVASSPFPPIDDRSTRFASFMVRSAIDWARANVQNRGGVGLRADAELLLYLAFTELVARPVITVRDATASSDLAEAIAADVALITNRAIDTRKGEGMVSAHDIVNATATLWPELRSAAWDIWD